MMYYVYGIDVSRWQGKMDWARAKSRGVMYAALRCTVGNYYFDPTFPFNWDECKQLGIKVTPYTVPAFDGSSVDSQLGWFFSKFGDRVPDMPVVGDYETAMIRGMSRREIDIFTHQHLAGLTNYKGWDDPWFYSNANFCNNYLYPSDAWQHYMLWVASYPSPPLPIREFPPTMPRYWDEWGVHQYSADGNMAGPKYGASSASIDLDRMQPEVWKWVLEHGTEEPEPEPCPMPNIGKVHLVFNNDGEIYDYTGEVGRVN